MAEMRPDGQSKVNRLLEARRPGRENKQYVVAQYLPGVQPLPSETWTVWRQRLPSRQSCRQSFLLIPDHVSVLA